MAVKILTDSVADLPPEVTKDLDITVVPMIVRFGEREYRDGIDLSSEQFYAMLKDCPTLPVTSMPPPGAFVEAYLHLADRTDEILAIMVSSRLSGTCNVARQSVALIHHKCRVEVIDSGWATMAQGFIVIKAARAARDGKNLNEIIELCRQTIPRVDFLSTFDTLDYLRRGGRIGKAQALLGSMLKINPLITLRSGVVEPAGRVRSREKAIECLYQFALGYSLIEEMAVEDTACPEEAAALAERFKRKFPTIRIYRSKMTPAIGTHTGPGLLLTAVIGNKNQ